MNKLWLVGLIGVGMAGCSEPAEPKPSATIEYAGVEKHIFELQPIGNWLHSQARVENTTTGEYLLGTKPVDKWHRSENSRWLRRTAR